MGESTLINFDRHRYVTSSEYRESWGREYLKKKAFDDPQKLVVGSNGCVPDDTWVMSDKEYLNIIDRGDWERYYRPGVIDLILAEHVFEHLTKDQAHLAARNCYLFLKSKGSAIISVPDGNHPDERYIDAVKPGGTGHSAYDHKMLWTLQKLRAVFEYNGFRVNPIEYWDHHSNEGPMLHYADNFPYRKFLTRSLTGDERARRYSDVNMTSLIIHACKE
ncbi:MAG: hypothetical protein GF334_06455 [Candidatus Altiarchaeales archaeon]|nr:hypothetical protein [Candidatus Altiarchaeales archaeon]